MENVLLSSGGKIFKENERAIILSSILLRPISWHAILLSSQIESKSYICMKMKKESIFCSNDNAIK